MYKILNSQRLNKVVNSMDIEAPYVARRCQPGQFVIVRVDEEGERIPLTIADYDREKNSVTIIYQELGYSTKKLSTKKTGEYIEDIAGPLGMPAPLDKEYKRVLAIGGGVGIAPLYPQVRELANRGTAVDVILGGRTAELVILEDKFTEIANLTIATDDGSKGMKGTVVDALKELVKENKYDLVIAIGPVPMMRAVVELTKSLNIPTNVSLNPIMIDGTGMCGGCRVTVGGETKFACVDGPDFDGFLVDFDELMRRQRMYKDTEVAFEKEHEHECRIGLGGEK
ncbi:sulfide/dihydroorotate dehydrogenase-like FAD/NAD-binding protein [Xylanivirga thermophila]|uniref:sulfide/dihydroorotate dehydrogenase-like FAD/NAD-binding protein n=1 Tax=Xylanivirga thermophila TaxID=2496273 RepID=UPI00101E1DB8|nr:sulfide/dihydroorotate dehydrogenase-like FAD/NAD-binding protein [Xylanivirga thermophila]